MNGLRVLVADDHPMCREAVRIVLLTCAPDARVLEASTLQGGLDLAADAQIIVLDLGLPDSRGIASLIDVVRSAPNARILVVSGSEQPAIARQAAEFGASGFVSKMAPLVDLVAAMRAVLAGERWFPADALLDDVAATTSVASRLASLSPAESRVLRAMRGGALNKQIAHDLGLSEFTVKQHIKAVLRKLGVINRTQAILALHELGEDSKISLP